MLRNAERDLEILTAVGEGAPFTQRALAERLGVALGPLGWPAVPIGAAVAALATAGAIVGIGHPAPRANLAYAALVLRLPRRAE